MKFDDHECVVGLQGVIMSDVVKEKAIRLLKKRESMSSLCSQDVRARRGELTLKTHKE